MRKRLLSAAAGVALVGSTLVLGLSGPSAFADANACPGKVDNASYVRGTGAGGTDISGGDLLATGDATNGWDLSMQVSLAAASCTTANYTVTFYVPGTTTVIGTVTRQGDAASNILVLGPVHASDAQVVHPANAPTQTCAGVVGITSNENTGKVLDTAPDNGQPLSMCSNSGGAGRWF